MTPAVPEPVEIMRDLRQRALTVPPADLGFEPTSVYPYVFGVVMDTGYPDALVTLVSLVDGTTSLYFGTGGGVIGAGEHDAVRLASFAFLDRAQRCLPQLIAVRDFPLPAIGVVRFYVRTYEGVRGAAAAEEELMVGMHDLSSLFAAGHAVIGAIREHMDRPSETRE